MRPPRVQRALRLAIIGLALAGAWVSGTLLSEHDGGWSAESQGTGYLVWLCGSPATPAASCADVIAGRWGSFDVHFGSRRVVVPTSFVGLAYFVAVAVWFLMIGPLNPSGRWLCWGTLSAATVGLAGSAFFMVLMAFVLSQWCPLCVIAHLLNALVFCGVVLLWRASRRQAACDPRSVGKPASGDLRFSPRPVLPALLVIVAAVAGLWLYYDAASAARRQWRKLAAATQVINTLQNDPDFMLREYYAQPIVHIPAGDSFDARDAEGPTDAGATLVVFTDYDCSACACFEYQRRVLIEDSFNCSLTVDVRYYPRTLVAASNGEAGNMTASDHRGFEPGFAAEAARLQGDNQALATMRLLLFKHRNSSPERDYAALARTAELDVQRFLSDMSSEAVRSRVLGDVVLATELGVSSTPAVFLNGRKVPDLCFGSTVFWETIAGKLAQQRVAVSSHADASREPTP